MSVQSDSVIDTWEKLYSEGRQANRYPFSGLVSLVHRHLEKLPATSNVLELGCGFGPNIVLFSDLGFKFYGIEGSSIACQHASATYPESTILQGDFSKPLPFIDQFFDLVVDRSAITHNKESIPSILEEVHRVIRPGGLYIGTDYFGKRHHLASHVTTSRSENRFKLALFTDGAGLAALFYRFDVVYLARNTTERLDSRQNTFEFYDIVAQKSN